MTVWHGCCLHIVWHASLFGWTLYIVCLKQREILIMRASWHAATMLTKISFVYCAKIACPCYHHYAGNPVEGHKFKDLLHNPTKSREESQSTYRQKMRKKCTIIDDATFYKILPSGSSPGILYGLSKVHKTGCPFRPIVSSFNTYNYNLILTLFLCLSQSQPTNTLKKTVRMSSCSIRTAVTGILNLPLHLNRTMQFGFWTFLSHIIQTTLSWHPSTKRKLSQVSAWNGIP